MRIYRKRFSVNGWSLGVWPRHIYIHTCNRRTAKTIFCLWSSQGENLCLIFVKIGETSFRFLKNCVYLPPFRILVIVKRIEFTWIFIQSPTLYLIWLPMLKDISACISSIKFTVYTRVVEDLVRKQVLFFQFFHPNRLECWVHVDRDRRFIVWWCRLCTNMYKLSVT